MDIKELLRRETKKNVSFDDYDHLFFCFEMIVKSDIGLDCVEGIHERLFRALSKYASEKKDNHDFYDVFSDIKDCYEPFVKKCLGIIAPKKLTQLANSQESSLSKVLLAINNDNKDWGLERTKYIRLSLKFRNIGDHELRTMSYAECADKISVLLTCYLIVVDSKRDELIHSFNVNAINRKDFYALDMNCYKMNAIEDIQAFLRWGINPKIDKIKRIITEDYKKGTIAVRTFNTDGRLEKRYWISELGSDIDEKHADTFCIFNYIENDNLIKQLSYYISSDGITPVNSTLFVCKFEYDSNGRLLKNVEINEKNPNKNTEAAMRLKEQGYNIDDFETDFELRHYTEREIEYLSNGGIKIKHIGKHFRDNEWHSSLRSYIEYDSYGRSVKERHHQARSKSDYLNDGTDYIYDDAGNLIREKSILYRKYIDVKYAGNEVLFFAKSDNNSNSIGILVEKRIYKNNKIFELIQYSCNDIGLEEAVGKMFFEYY